MENSFALFDDFLRGCLWGWSSEIRQWNLCRLILIFLSNLVPFSLIFMAPIYLVSTYVVCERLSVMHKQVSGWTVNFCLNSPESPFLEFQTRKPPPPILENFRFEMTKVYSEIPPPPHFRKLQIWDDQSLPKFTPKYPPPHFGKLQIWDDQSLLWNSPPPHFGKLQIWDDQSLLRNNPPPCCSLAIREIVCGD